MKSVQRMCCLFCPVQTMNQFISKLVQKMLPFSTCAEDEPGTSEFVQKCFVLLVRAENELGNSELVQNIF